MLFRFFGILLLTGFLFCYSPLTALGATANQSVRASFSTGAPLESGSEDDLKDASWASAVMLNSFTDLNSRLAGQPTTAYLLFGSEALYCAFVSEQIEPIVATQTLNNGALGIDDYVQLSFDTSENGFHTYSFATTPNAIRYQTSSESNRYDPVWIAKASKSKGRWFAEFAIPYSIIKSPRNGALPWRLNLTRYIAASQHQYSWAYSSTMISATDSSFWPKLTDIPSVAGTRGATNAQIYGLLSAGSNRSDVVEASGAVERHTSRFIGADFQTPLTSGLSVVGTLNPDSSNVEADQQITAPQEFPVHYQEYRPFFTQGANFLPSAEIFYSPNIGEFFRGEKVEGQDGLIGIGILNVGGDARSDTAYQGSYTSLDQAVSLAISGAQVDANGAHDLVNEISGSYTNLRSRLLYAAGVSHDDNSLLGSAASDRSYLYVAQNQANVQSSAAYYDVGPNYSPLDSYVAVNDIRGPALSVAANSSENPRVFYKQITGYAYADRYVDHTGAARQADIVANGSLQLRNLLTFAVGTNLSELRDYAVPFPVYAEGVTTAYHQQSASIGYRLGTSDATSVSFSAGPYASRYLHQLDIASQRQIARSIDLSFEYHQNTFNSKAFDDGQILRRFSLFKTFSTDESVGLNYRVVSGSGGFSQPGTNVAALYKRRIGKDSKLYVEIGSPAAPRTLNRVIVKYSQFLGGGAGE